MEGYVLERVSGNIMTCTLYTDVIPDKNARNQKCRMRWKEGW
jgi:hypothetical protein